ncbi:MAG: hypothetical protein AAFX80_04405 [Cyanobacteria bacterium J06639_18]
MQRAYVRCDISAKGWCTDFRILPKSESEQVTVKNDSVPIATAVSFEIPHRGVVQQV